MKVVVESLKFGEILNLVDKLPIGEKWLLFKILQKDLSSKKESLRHFTSQANDLDVVENVLLKKKEDAIVEIQTLLPFVALGKDDVKETYLKILPVLFSYVSLYDMKLAETYQIVELLCNHPVFADDTKLFSLWIHIFEARKQSSKRFTYKDESYVRDLPNLDPSLNDNHPFAKGIGYSNIPVLRAVHRWLRWQRLHKYLYFFANLSYEEILQIGASNLDAFEKRVGMTPITIGAKNKIVREIETLRNRRLCLEEKITMNFEDIQAIDKTIREIKQILRTPISIKDDGAEENLPSLLMRALGRVVDSLYYHIGTSENVIPTYGLFISVLKEAWNYSIFKEDERELFNIWREILSNKYDMISSRNEEKWLASLPLDLSTDILCQRDLSTDILYQSPETPQYDDLKEYQCQDSNSTNSFYEQMENLAIECANLIFL